MTREFRPFGVTILAVLEGLSSLAALGLGVLLLIAVRFLHFFGIFAAVAGVIFIIIGLLDGLLAWGLWTGRRWAWTASLVLTSISAILSLPGLPWSLLKLLLDALILYYLIRTHVKQYFGQAVSSVIPPTQPQYSYQPPSSLSPPATPQQQTTTTTDAAGFCHNCGAPLALGASFCSRCGEQVRRPL